MPEVTREQIVCEVPGGHPAYFRWGGVFLCVAYRQPSGAIKVLLEGLINPETAVALSVALTMACEWIAEQGGKGQ